MTVKTMALSQMQMKSRFEQELDGLRPICEICEREVYMPQSTSPNPNSFDDLFLKILGNKVDTLDTTTVTRNNAFVVVARELGSLQPIQDLCFGSFQQKSIKKCLTLSYRIRSDVPLGSRNGAVAPPSPGSYPEGVGSDSPG